MATGSKEIHPQDEDAATGKSTVQIRQVRAADLEACARIEQVCFLGDGASWERIALRIRDYPQGFRVALLDGQVAGFINSGSITGEDIADDRLKELDGHDPAGETRVVFSLAVDPQYQGQGIGRLLLESFIADARKSGGRLVLLICRRSLIPFYQRFGFVYRRPSNATYGRHRWHEMGLAFF